MLLDYKTAAIDNDFINHVFESNLEDDKIVRMLTTVFAELGLTPVMHPLVYDKELMKDKTQIINLFQQGVVYKVTFGDIFQNTPAKEAYYSYLVKELYHYITGTSFPGTTDSVLTFWKTQHSMGEIHSISMCLVCGCGIFLSDDGDSKKIQSYVIRKSLGKIDVYNRTELIDKHLNEGITKFRRVERKSLTHMAR